MGCLLLWILKNTDVVVVIKMGAYIHGSLSNLRMRIRKLRNVNIVCSCFPSYSIRFHMGAPYVTKPCFQGYFINCDVLYTRYTHAHHVPHAEHVEMAKFKTQSRRHHGVLRLSCPRVSEKSKSLVYWCASCLLSRLSCLSSFCWAVNCLLYLWTCSGVIFYPPSPQPPSQWHHERHVPKKYVNYV